jgi:hypothetical protein
LLNVSLCNILFLLSIFYRNVCHKGSPFFMSAFNGAHRIRKWIYYIVPRLELTILISYDNSIGDISSLMNLLHFSPKNRSLIISMMSMDL